MTREVIISWEWRNAEIIYKDNKKKNKNKDNIITNTLADNTYKR